MIIIITIITLGVGWTEGMCQGLGEVRERQWGAGGKETYVLLFVKL